MMKWSRKMWYVFFSVVSVCCIVNASFSVGVPSVLNYQGTLTDSSGNPVTGQHDMTFRLYNELLGGTAFWEEAQSVTLDINGHFSVSLGSTTPLAKDNFNGQTFIGIQVGTDPELAPRQQLTSVAYALKTADAIPAGGIIMWSGIIDAIPNGWALCDGNDGTPNLQDRFIVGAGNGYAVGDNGGVTTINLSHGHNVNTHYHSISSQSPGTNPVGNHAHHIDTNVYSHIGDTEDKVENGDEDETVGSEKHGHHLVADTWGAGGHSHTVNSHNHGGNTGSSAPGTNSQLSSSVENRPPYYALAYIMKL